MDRDDLRIVLGVLVLSLAVLWSAVVLGAAVFVFRLIGGV